MKYFLGICLFSILMITNKPYKVDFGKNKDGKEWRVVNDGVMGGLSRGSLALTDNSILFKGEVSLDNNGGLLWL